MLPSGRMSARVLEPRSDRIKPRADGVSPLTWGPWPRHRARPSPPLNRRPRPLCAPRPHRRPGCRLRERAPLRQRGLHHHPGPRTAHERNRRRPRKPRRTLRLLNPLPKRRPRTTGTPLDCAARRVPGHEHRGAPARLDRTRYPRAARRQLPLAHPCGRAERRGHLAVLRRRGPPQMAQRRYRQRGEGLRRTRPARTRKRSQRGAAQHYRGHRPEHQHDRRAAPGTHRHEPAAVHGTHRRLDRGARAPDATAPSCAPGEAPRRPIPSPAHPACWMRPAPYAPPSAPRWP